METKSCKKCGRPLPENYKHKKCENCRNNVAKAWKDAGKVALSLAAVVSSAVIFIATKGKNNPGGKK